jgi:hypothetical protein
MTNKDLFKNVDKKKRSKEIDGYYFDGKKSYTLYKNEDGEISYKINKQKKGKKK